MTKVLSEPVPRPEWAPLPRSGCHGVEFKVLLERPDLGLAMLRIGRHSSIDEHPAPCAVDVICLEGKGMFSVDGEPAPLRAGERVLWPAARPHRLWTEDATMLTLMVEHLA
jgi:quercetin dioxygenase-like cupin family protein